MRTTSSSMSIFVRGLPGWRRSRNVHFFATNSRCQHNRVSGVTIESSSRNALLPIPFASPASVRRSASVNRIRRFPNLDRSARWLLDSRSVLRPVARANWPCTRRVGLPRVAASTTFCCRSCHGVPNHKRVTIVRLIIGHTIHRSRHRIYCFACDRHQDPLPAFENNHASTFALTVDGSHG
jgi:hypothetical protein